MAKKQLNEISKSKKEQYIKKVDSWTTEKIKERDDLANKGEHEKAAKLTARGLKRATIADKVVDKMKNEDVDVSIQNQKTVEMKPNKANQMATAITLMQAMSGDEINNLLATLQQNSQTASASIPDDTAAKNAASIAMKGVVSEELTEIFGSQELTEDFKERVSVLFESVVNAKVAVEKAQLEEQFEQKLNEETQIQLETLTDQVDRYLSYVAEEWMKENELAVENGIRTEIAEQFIIGLKNLANEFNINIPEDKVDVLEQYQERVDQLQEENNRLLAENIEAQEILAQSIMEDAFDSVVEGMAMSEVEKFRTLAETVDFEGDVDAYKNKLNIIKESHFMKKSGKSSDASLVLSESVEKDDEPERDQTLIDPTVARYADFMSRFKI